MGYNRFRVKTKPEKWLFSNKGADADAFPYEHLTFETLIFSG
jgi:hypothetical protein